VDRKIWTAEDPIEINQPGLRQLQVRPRIGLTFAAALRSFLRADPDVIMLGEMRDEETASTALDASLTGHLVLSTLHTNSAAETVTRLVEIGLEPFSFAGALLGVLAQRLVRGLCTDCRKQHPPTQSERERITAELGEGALDAQVASDDTPLMLWRAEGCESCRSTGYAGRIPVQELLVADAGLRRAIERRASSAEITQLAKDGGMTTLVQDGLRKAVAGRTDLAQVLAACRA
jgi:type II secretory ATPase GspE/PulE/Tfp pilus assembly ATPase PilB-like protein